MSGPERGYQRSRERADAIRAQLEPLGPDERPLGIKLAVALAVFLSVANIVAALAGPAPLAFAYALGLAALAVGVWQRRYLAVLAFQALLALTMIVSTLSLAFAGDLVSALIAVAVIVICAPIFWLLVRVMARLQVPQR